MNVFIIPIEPLESRYTAQWYEHFPNLIRTEAMKLNKDVIVHNIDGEITSAKPTEGAFLDFAATNIYKSSQLIKIAKLFQSNTVKDGDKFIFADAWNPAILQVKYMAELLNIKVIIHGLFHAGSYDSQDFLGRLIKDKRWTNNFEKSLFHAIDHNWFATQFHIDMFKNNVFSDDILFSLSDWEIQEKFCKTGWPMEYMTPLLTDYKGLPKRDLILFPHRVAPEKQVDIFKDLAKSMPQYEFVVCQEQNLSKDEYHKLLGESKMVFSANLQETLGISCFEGAVVGSFPLVPDRLSYSEMYSDFFTYNSKWTESFDSYLIHKESLMKRIEKIMSGYEYTPTYRTQIEYLSLRLQGRFFSASELIKELFK